MSARKEWHPEKVRSGLTHPVIDSDGHWIEVANYQPAGADGAEQWEPIQGKEQMILGDLSLLTDGAPVEVAPTTDEAKVASTTPDRPPAKTASSVPTTSRAMTHSCH